MPLEQEFDFPVCASPSLLDAFKRARPRSGRVDEYTGKRFTFCADPDGLPLELYEC